MTDLTPRAIALFDHLCALAAAGARTPLTAEMLAALRAQGHEATHNKGIVAWELERLRRDGMIRILGSQQTRVFEIVATGERTVRREGRVRSEAQIAAMSAAQTQRLADMAGWPQPTAESAAAYDAAVARREFARHECRPPAKDAPRVHARQRAAAEPWSYVGCSAAMAVSA